MLIKAEEARCSQFAIDPVQSVNYLHHLGHKSLLKLLKVTLSPDNKSQHWRIRFSLTKWKTEKVKKTPQRIH